MEFPRAIRLVNGWLEVVTGGYQVKTAFVTTGGAPVTTIVSAVAGRSIRVLSYRLQARNSNASVANARFQDNTRQALSQIWDLNPREGCVVNSGPTGFEFQAVPGIAVEVLQNNAADSFNATVIYIEV